MRMTHDEKYGCGEKEEQLARGKGDIRDFSSMDTLEREEMVERTTCGLTNSLRKT